MNKDIVILRKSQVCADIVEHFIYRELRGENDLNYDQLTNFLVMMFGVLKLDNKVYRFFSLKLEDKIPWRAFIESLMRGSDTKEGEELNQFMLFYRTMENTIPLSRIQRASDISPINLLYLIDRLLPWTSLLKDGVIHATKSTMTEWLIHQESIKRLNGQTNLEGVHEYLANLLLEFSRQNSNWTEQWTRRHGGISTLMFLHRIVVAACMLHLSSRNHFSLLEAMLSNSGITYYLQPKFWKVLSDGRTDKHIGVQVVAGALQCFGNPFVIATLRHDSLDIACLAEAKDEIKLSMNPDSFWDWLDSLVKRS
ncbi:hypothetical protein TSUD_306090 [Trifolium subterraneum]|uniref:Uncharacterized protein n=1 Tax=Trifolium subterraneum TaxID=3900 RepID=A0A2Z6LUQ0_TRISU|nr:hypothetical protein TSUD_306090 [Trifolium subterraneum]